MGENFFFSDFEKFHGSLGGELTLKRKQGLHSSSGFNTHFCFCKQANTSLNCSSEKNHTSSQTVFEGIRHRRKRSEKREAPQLLYHAEADFERKRIVRLDEKIKTGMNRCMKLQISTTELHKADVDLLALGCFEASSSESITLQRHDGGVLLNRLLDQHLETSLHAQGFLGKLGTTRLFPTLGKIKAPSILVLGLGPKEKFSIRTLKQIGAKLVRESEKIRARSLALVIQEQNINGFHPERRLSSLIEGMILGHYRFETYKTKKEISSLKEISFLTPRLSASLQQALLEGEALGKGMCFARDLINAPANILTPEVFATEAMNMAKAHGIACTVLTEKEIKQEKMGALLAVARGSEHPPRFLHLRYRPKTKSRMSIALVGKGITFYTLGISLKEVQGMEKMKYDVGGAATILGALQAISVLKAPVAVDAYIPLAENMPDGKAFRPGDILTTRSGKTVEIMTTDAEGRLILADALSYATDPKPDYMIDLGTLTGAAVQALGSLYAGLFGNDEKH